jgi:hypothetical protein
MRLNKTFTSGVSQGYRFGSAPIRFSTDSVKPKMKGWNRFINLLKKVRNAIKSCWLFKMNIFTTQKKNQLWFGFRFFSMPKYFRFFSFGSVSVFRFRFGFRPSGRKFSVSVRFSVIKMKNFCRICTPGVSWVARGCRSFLTSYGTNRNGQYKA